MALRQLTFDALPLRPLRQLQVRLPSAHPAASSTSRPTPPLPFSVRHLSTSLPLRRDLGARYRRPKASPIAAMLLTDIPAPADDLPPAPPKPRDTPVDVAGVRVPPRPRAPGDEDCCMSGCVHCVLTLYAEDLELYNNAVEEARGALTKQGVPRSKWPKAVTESEDGDDEPAPNVDPTMAAFLALESKVKKKQAKPVDPGIAAFRALEAKLRKK